MNYENYIPLNEITFKKCKIIPIIFPVILQREMITLSVKGILRMLKSLFLLKTTSHLTGPIVVGVL